MIFCEHVVSRTDSILTVAAKYDIFPEHLQMINPNTDEENKKWQKYDFVQPETVVRKQRGSNRTKTEKQFSESKLGASYLARRSPSAFGERISSHAVRVVRSYEEKTGIPTGVLPIRAED